MSKKKRPQEKQTKKELATLDDAAMAQVAGGVIIYRPGAPACQPAPKPKSRPGDELLPGVLGAG